MGKKKLSCEIFFNAPTKTLDDQKKNISKSQVVCVVYHCVRFIMAIFFHVLALGSLLLL